MGAKLSSESNLKSDSKSNVHKACFAAGCFWGTEKYFKKKFPKIMNQRVGYIGGTKINPSYEDICKKNTLHAEGLIFEFDTMDYSYEELCGFFLSMHDPTTLNKQQGDIGTQYRSAIFYFSEEQKAAAQETINTFQPKWQVFKKDPHCRIVTTLESGIDNKFYDAEDYHQHYLEKNSGGYCSHRIYKLD